MADEKALNEVFAEFDADNSGFLTQQELEKVLKQVAKDPNCGITEDDISAACAYIVELADQNKDGKISKAEFVKFTKEYVDKK